MSERKARAWITYGVFGGRVDPPEPPQPPDPAVEALERARYEADQARAQIAKLTKQMEELRQQVPSDEQRAQWAALEAERLQQEEIRKRKEGEFDAWRRQIEEKHQKELDGLRQEAANASAQAASHEKELNDTLIGLAFSDAADWFGPTGKTVMIPSVAQSYFAPYVAVEVVPGINGGRATRRVVVKDYNGTVIVDTKTGKPASFAQAIGELIENHPQKAHLLRGSGKVGSGSAGGANGGSDIDLTRLKPGDFNNPEVRKRLKEQQASTGGMQIGPAFDRIAQQQGTKS